MERPNKMGFLIWPNEFSLHCFSFIDENYPMLLSIEVNDDQPERDSCTGLNRNDLDERIFDAYDSQNSKNVGKFYLLCFMGCLLHTAQDFVFVHVVEEGPLEHESLLLINSIRKYGGIYSNCPIYAICPTNNNKLSTNTLREYRKLNVIYETENLNRRWSEYPFVNTSYAAKYIEENAPQNVEFIVLMDTDTIITAEPNELKLPEAKKVGLRPIDSHKNEISFLPNEKIPFYWKKVFSVCNTDPDRLWNVETTMDHMQVSACFNNGVVVSRIESRLFTSVVESMELASDDEYFKDLNRNSLEWHFLDQAFLSAVIIRDFEKEQINLLGSGYNFPFPKSTNQDEVKNGFRDVAILHYHSNFFKTRILEFFSNNNELQRFLSEYLPLPVNGGGIFINFAERVPRSIRKKIRNSRIFPLVKAMARLFNVRIV